LSGGDQDALRRVIGRSVAVSSGKGGVGKTITACNLAIYYARKGLRVGLADLDPLSDVASLLDIYESEQALKVRDPATPAEGLGSFILPVFKGLEILFPYQKLDPSHARATMETLYSLHLKEIDARYDVLIFDMPAGMSYDNNLAYVPFMKRLVLVTNPEPTAHASAGAYAKEVLRLYPGTIIHLWHNRYSRKLREGFHPSDVAGNYNRFVQAEDRLSSDETPFLRDFAFVPEDPALDLLQGEPSPAIHVLKSMRDALEYAQRRLLTQAAKKIGIPPRILDMVTSYVHRNPAIDDPAAYLVELDRYLGVAMAAVSGNGPLPQSRVFDAAETDALKGFLLKVRQSGLRHEMQRMEDLIAAQLRRWEEARSPFGSRLPPGQDKAIDRELGRFLVILNRAARGSGLMRNQGILLLFYFSLHKLFQSRTLVAVLRSLIPRRVNQRGRKVRDRFRQIRTLVERDPHYRQRYLKALGTLHALVMRQVAAVARALDLNGLVIVDDSSRIDGQPYLKLLAAFLHESLYSGLSVIVGFDYRSAAAAFQQGAESLLSSVQASD
jgi:flagellar biosynthesis protein FlhG